MDALFALLVMAGASGAGGSPALTLVSEERTTSIPLAAHGGEIWVPVSSGLLKALGRGVESVIRLPRITVTHGGISIGIAVGLNRACAKGRGGQRVLWLPDAPRMAAGSPVLTPESLACVLRYLGLSAEWVQASQTLTVNDPVQVAAGVGAMAEPVDLPERRPEASPLRVILDPGHGGADCGAQGRTGLCEKAATLDLCQRMKKILEKRGVRVLMTRDRDSYVSLKRRVALARDTQGDLFVSVHVNAARDRRARGVETYVYGREALNERDAALVRRENADSNYVDIIVSDLNQQRYHDASIHVAGAIEASLVAQMRLYGRSMHRVKEAPFYVLARSHLPAVLIEVGFISNPTEERMLRSSSYRQGLAETITGGVLRMARHAAGD